VKGERQNSNEMCTRRIFFSLFGVEKRDPFFPSASLIKKVHSDARGYYC